MGNPLFEAIERLTNPYAMQERVYRNRRDEEQVKHCQGTAGHADGSACHCFDAPTCSTGECQAPCCWDTGTVTPLEVIVIRDADHLREVLDAVPDPDADLAFCPGCQASASADDTIQRFAHVEGCRFTGKVWNDKLSQWTEE